jgi:multidrug efflux pump
VQSVTTWIGSGVPRFYLPLDQIFPQTNVSQAIVLPKDLAEREALRKRCRTLLAEEFPEVRGRVKLLPNGPPVPYPVQFRVVGDDAAQVRAVGRPAKEVLRANPNMRGVNDNWNESVKVLRLDRPGQGARAGRHQPGHRPGLAHHPQRHHHRPVPRGDKLIDIVLRQPLDERNAITDLATPTCPRPAAARCR